jgi:hypothetical protein
MTKISNLYSLTNYITADSSGSVGIGIAPQFSLTNMLSLEISNTGLIYGGNGQMAIGNNAYYSTSWKYKTTNYATLHTTDSGVFQWSTAVSGTANNTISWVDRMRMTNGGNLLVNQTSPNGGGALEVTTLSGQNTTAVFNSTTTYGPQVYLRDAGGAGFANIMSNSAIVFKNGSSFGETARITTGGYLGIGISSPSYPLQVTTAGGAGITSADGSYAPSLWLHYNVSNTGNPQNRFRLLADQNAVYFDGADAFPLVFRNNSYAERMRITAAGYLLIGTTDASGSANLIIGGSTSTCRVLPQTDGGGYIGDSAHRWIAIYAQNGSINTSDRNQKKNITPTDLGLSFVNQLNPVSYSWKEGEETEKKHYGIIAQEVEEVAPDFGGIWNENGKYGFSYTELISPLIKSIQELSAKVTALENK